MKRNSIFIPVMFIYLAVSFFYCSSGTKSPAADIILKNGDIYTMEPAGSWAKAVVIKGNKILAVLQEKDLEKLQAYTGEKTRVIDLKGKFALPGFIDGHIHFNRAGSLLVDVNLMKVSDDEGLRKEIKRVADILDDDEWITGGLWGAYEQWELGTDKAGKGNLNRWKPHRRLIDDITPNNPCLLVSFDYKLYLANSAALRLAGINQQALTLMETDGEGKPTGLIYPNSPALKKIRSVIKAKSHERMINENRAALKHLAACGIVEVHDIAQPDQTRRFVELQENGELTCRVWLRPDLSRVKELRVRGFTMGMHPESKKPDAWLRYGALKGYIDGIMGNHGALFFKPYNDEPGNYGHYRQHTSDDKDLKIPNLEKMYAMVKAGYQGGFVSNVHAIGTKGVALMLDIYERLRNDLQIDLKGFRVIHAQVIRPRDFQRFKQLNVIAEINPYHLSDDMRWMEERIGRERCKGAYAFKTLLDNGCILSFGSDWPGTNAAEYFCHPKYLIHAAVNRTTLRGIPEGGWFPGEKISVHEALKAYTINNAYACFEEKIRGSIKEGKLADITVCDRNLLEIDPKDILNLNILMTMVDGKIVFSKL